MAYTFDQLKALWISAGGNATAAAVAAAVALAESGGRPDAFNGNGGRSQDRGLWQINSVHGAQSSFDPMTNARAAVAISNNGTNWKPWCVAYTDGACGTKGGRFDPTGASPAGKRLAGNGGGTIPPGGGDTSVPPPGGGGSVVPAAVGPLDADFWNNLADQFAGGLLKAANHIVFLGAAVLGSVSVVIGLLMLFRNSEQGQSITIALSQAGNAYKNVAKAPLRVVKS